MGFDNECIVNIQSLAGEYFCPVCRLLVFPDEALQTQCTHLYCKPCLTYTVSTTRACPYDGYLVTEADSKPLRESNKALADTIGKIAVHCLYHRSGCTWQGILSDCTTHCSGCAYGNSPVVCNRCGIQIVHRQVQEHAQNCPGVQGQAQQAAIAQDPSATSAVASTDQNQVAAPVGATASQFLTSQTAVTTTTPGQVSNQLTNQASQTQALVQSSVQPTAEQWYQQQQYQQYYQQYPGQDSYQQQYQHYYPYQQPVVPQYQQAYGHPQPQSQSQPQPHAPHQSQPQLQPQPQPQAPQAQGLSQPLSQIQAPVAPSSQNQTQVHQPQQVQPALQPHGQTNPPSHGQALPQPQPYPYTQAQPHSVQPQPQQNMQMPHQQPLPQMQNSQSQIQQPVSRYSVPQSQVHPQVQSNAPVQHLSQPPMYPHQPVTPNVQPQVQNTTSHAVTGHHSYPQPPHPNMQPGVSQHTMHVHPHSGPQPQAQHPVQMQNQFPPQIPMMRPNQSHAMFPNQPQPAVLPSPVPGQTPPPLQQQPLYTHNQQPGQINQRPMLQSVQQVPQQPFAPHQMATSPLRPQAPAHSFPKHAYPQLQGNTALSNSAQHSQSQNAVGRPVAPNHTGHTQQFVQSVNTNSVRPGQTGAGYPPENHNLLVGTNNQAQLSSELQSRASEPIERQGDVHVSASANELKSEKSETNLKQIEVGNKQNSEDPQSMKTSVPNTNALENGNSVNKNLGMGEAVASNMKPSSGNKSGIAVPGPPGVLNNSNEHSVRSNEFQDGLPTKTETKLTEPETDKLHSDDTCVPIHPLGASNPVPSVSQGNGSFAQPSHSAIFTDQSKHQQPMINYGPPPVQNRSSAMSASQSPHPAIPNQPLSEVHSSNLVRNHGLAHAPGQGFQPQSIGGNPGPYNQIHETPFHAGASNMSHIGGPQFGAPLHGDMHGRMTANLSRHAPESFGLQDERFKHFHVPNQKNIDRREFDDDLKKFPRLPLDAEPVSKFGNYSLGLHETGKRPVDFYDDVIKKSGSTLHPGYLGPGPGYGRHHMDGMAPRSPLSEYTEMSSRRLGTHSGGKPGIDDFDGRVARRYAEFHDNRFSHFPSHLHRDEFDNFGNFRMGEHPRSGEFIGQEEFAGHFRRGDHLVPHNFPRHLQLGEPGGFGAHPGHMRAVELSGSRSIEPFSKGGHPQLGEPGFRSSFSLSGLPNDTGISTGDIRSFDNSRRRKAYSMGWCRICKVDCETVEGLDLHSQTREHQRMAMDIVKAIKQNAKKLKLIASEQPSIHEGKKTWNTGFEGRGSKR